MIMTPALRRFALTVHVASSVAVPGAVAGFLVLAVSGLISPDAQVAWAAYHAMDLTAGYAIVPLVFMSVVTGLIQSLGTTWGLFRHWWVVTKLLVTAVATVVLLLQLRQIAYLADPANVPLWTGPRFDRQRLSPVVHAAAGLLVLLIPVMLSVYKPPGLTPYGWRRQHERPAGSDQRVSPPGPAPG